MGIPITTPLPKSFFPTADDDAAEHEYSGAEGTFVLADKLIIPFLSPLWSFNL